MFDTFEVASPTVLDMVRWVTIIWLLTGISWMIQLAVVVRTKAVSYLAAGVALSLFLDISGQYDRLGIGAVSYRLPVNVLLLIMITIGIRRYVASNPAIEWVRWFPVLFRIRRPGGPVQEERRDE